MMEIIEKSERAHFFTPKEQQLLIEGYEEERPILTAKSNTVRASKMREEAWQRIADKLYTHSGSGYKRTWQQVKIKYKNLVQTANRKKAEFRKDDEGPANIVIKSDESDDEFLLQQSSSRPMVEGIPGGTSSEPAAACSSASYISVTGHSLTLLPPPQSDPEHSVCDETLSSDTHLDEDFDPLVTQEKGRATGRKTGEGQTEDIKTLYRRYLIKEMENREQEMAYRALKMRKVEKEIQLLDKQLEKQ